MRLDRRSLLRLALAGSLAPRRPDAAGRAAPRRGRERGALIGHASQGAVTLLDGSPLRVRRVLRGFGEPRYAGRRACVRHRLRPRRARRPRPAQRPGGAAGGGRRGGSPSHARSGGTDGLDRARLDGVGPRRRRAVVPLGSYDVAPGAAGVLTPSLGSGELTMLDAAGRVHWAVTIAGAAYDACLL